MAKVKVTYSLDEDLKKRVEAVARSSEMSQVDVVEKAIEKYVSEDFAYIDLLRRSSLTLSYLLRASMMRPQTVGSLSEQNAISNAISMLEKIRKSL